LVIVVIVVMVFSFLRSWRGVHPIEVAFEPVQERGPEASEASEPGVDLHEGLRSHAVEAPPCVTRDALDDDGTVYSMTRIYVYRHIPVKP
jgi:hypothetical protein